MSDGRIFADPKTGEYPSKDLDRPNLQVPDTGTLTADKVNIEVDVEFDQYSYPTWNVKNIQGYIQVIDVAASTTTPPTAYSATKDTSGVTGNKASLLFMDVGVEAGKTYQYYLFITLTGDSLEPSQTVAMWGRSYFGRFTAQDQGGTITVAFHPDPAYNLEHM
ncbi:MAG: hypothetical protein AAFN81_12140 [Bacteroidota bacterium]